MPAQGSFEQVPPDGTQMPQLALQQTSDTLQVLGPHGALIGAAGDAQKSGQVSPGETQVLQFQLQHCCPLAHVRHPQRTGAASSEVMARAADATSCGRCVEPSATLLPAASGPTDLASLESVLGPSETAASIAPSGARSVPTDVVVASGRKP
jgi:hypothetical protein